MFFVMRCSQTEPKWLLSEKQFLTITEARRYAANYVASGYTVQIVKHVCYEPCIVCSEFGAAGGTHTYGPGCLARRPGT